MQNNNCCEGSTFKRILKICPGRHALLLLSGALVLLFVLVRDDCRIMVPVAERFVRPLHRVLSGLNSHIPFSVAELLIALVVLLVFVYLIITVIKLIKGECIGKTIYAFFMTLLSAGMTVYALFCLLWGVYYYGTDFITASGFTDSEISVAQLKSVTAYFADMANQASEHVTRDENGFYKADFDAILMRSDEVFSDVGDVCPCLEGPDIKAKGILHSRIMSYTDFTGFFFPFTAEANVNTDVPPTYFASTVAHELSHQRGVAREQDANFTAVLVSLNYGDPDYVYSSCLLAYCHLGNALYSADKEAWKEVYLTLPQNVLNDYSAEAVYWKQFETPVREVSSTVYENFLYSYDQDMGLKSYGACVDLLVNYYFDDAAAAGF